MRQIAATKFCCGDNDFHMSHEVIYWGNLLQRRVAAICRIMALWVSASRFLWNYRLSCNCFLSWYTRDAGFSHVYWTGGSLIKKSLSRKIRRPTCSENARNLLVAPCVPLGSTADFAYITYQRQTSQEQEEQSFLGEEIYHSVCHEAQGSHWNDALLMSLNSWKLACLSERKQKFTLLSEVAVDVASTLECSLVCPSENCTTIYRDMSSLAPCKIITISNITVW